jgi:hypothetical protein
MPLIPENDAASIARSLPTAKPEDHPWMLDTLTKYQDQQRELGLPDWPTQEAAQQAEQSRVRSLFTGGIDNVPFQPSPWSKDPALDRATVANQVFLAHRFNLPAQTIADRPDFYRNDYARQFFGQPGGVDEKAFYGLAAKQIQGEQQSEAATLDGVKAALQGHDIIPALQEWQKVNGLERMPDSTQFTKGFLGARQRTGEYLDFADNLLGLLESSTGNTKADGAQPAQAFTGDKAAELDGVIAQLSTMKPRDRKQVYAIIGAKAEAAGYDQKGFFSQMLGQLDKGIERMHSTVSTQAGVTADVLGNFPEMLTNTMKPGDFTATDSSIAKRQAIGDVHDEVANIVAGAVDPVKPTLGWMNDTLETGLIKGPGAVLPFMAASAALGPVGATALFTADFAEQNRRDLRAQGMDNDQAMRIGYAAAPLQAVTESLSNALQLGRFPAVQRVLSGFTKPIAGGAGLASRYLLNSGVSLATEFTEEQLQDNLIVPATQELLGALQSDVPYVDWSMYRNRAVESTPELLSVLAPMALVFGGTMTAAQAHLSATAVSSQDMLEAAGFSAAQANTIRATAPDAQISKAREMWGQRAGTPQSMEEAAKSVAERMKLLQTDHMAAQQDLEKRGILPRMLRAADDKWRLTFNDGSTADFNSHSEADAARWQWASDQLGKVHTSVQRTLAQMEKNADVGREFALQFSPDERHVTPEEMASQGMQDRVKQGELLDEVKPEQQFEDASAIGKASGDENTVHKILGSSVNTFKDGVLTTTMKLYHGANITTLVEEKLEGDAKAILADPDGKQWMLDHLRSYEQASGDKLFAHENDADITPAMLAEAWSHLGQSYLVGKSTDKGAWKGKTARAMFQYILQSGLSPVMNAETQYWRAVALRAQKLGEMQKAGKLGDDLVSTLEKQLGIDSTLKHEQVAESEAVAMGNEALALTATHSHTNESTGLTPHHSTPTLTEATLVRDTIHLDFDALAQRPTMEELRGAFPGSMIEEMIPDIVAGTKGTVSYRITALDDKGRMSSKKAAELYQKAFGTKDRIRTKSKLQKMGSLSERFNIGLKVAGHGEPAIDYADTSGYSEANPGPNGETFSLRATPADSSNVVAMPDGARLVGPTTFSIRAFHGTPHKVDKFSTGKIGTGEGAQVFGWGLYFAQNKSVAERYRAALSIKSKIDSIEALAQNALSIEAGNKNAAIASLRAFDIPGLPMHLMGRIEEAVTLIKNDNLTPLGNLYTVELLPDEEDFLDWDKPLSEQSEKVKDALVKEFGGLVQMEMTGSQWHDWMTNSKHAETDVKSFSQDCAKAGIPGIRYLDAGSRSAGDGSRNYVIFDESLVKILEENGKPVSNETFSLSAAGFNQVYLKNQDKFSKAVEEGRAKERVPLSTFDGQTLLLHQPDTAFAGTIEHEGSTVVSGKGGVYYPLLFGDQGYFWASTKAAAEWMARTLNAVSEENGGKILMGLTSAGVDKLFSSTTMSSGVLKLLTKLTAKPKEFGITQNVLNKMVVKASKVQFFIKPDSDPMEFKVSLSSKDSLEMNVDAMLKALAPDESAFVVRRTFVESLASQIAAHLSSNPAASARMAKMLAGEDNKYAKRAILSGKLSTASLLQGFGDILSEPFLKTFQQFNKGGQLYAVIQMDGKVEAVESKNHDSYPFALRSVEGKKPVVNVLEKAFPWQDVTSLGNTGQAVPEDLRNSVFPTSAGVSMHAKHGHIKVKSPSPDLKGIDLTFSLRSVTPAQDAEYMQAVRDGDVAKQQSMADAAAKRVGKKILWRSGPKSTNREGFMFLATNEDYANNFQGSEARKFYVTPGKILDLTEWDAEDEVPSKDFFKRLKDNGVSLDGLEPVSGEPLQQVSQRHDTTKKKLAENIAAAGYDSVALNEYVYGGGKDETLALLDDANAESANPITYKDGKPVPLSARFNPKRNEITYSIRSGDFSSRMADKFSPFQRSPELRMALGQVAKAQALKLGADVIEKGSAIRSVGSISQEARMREALAYESRMNEYLDNLSEAGRQDLEFQPADLESDPLVAAMLDHGKLMSRATAVESGKLSDKAGKYDGVPWLPPAWYSKGAGIMPDQMAQAMHDAGLLPDGHADTLWQALASRIESSRKDKSRAREAAKGYKAAQKYAKDASRAEADQWAEGAKKKSASAKSLRDLLSSWMRLADGILATAPPDVRARVGGYIYPKLAKLATDEARLKALEATIEKLNVELEKWLKKEGTAQIEKLLEKARPDTSPGKKVKGKDADMHHLFAAAERASKMDAAAVAGELARLDSLIAGDTLTPEQDTLATTERGIVELLGDLKNADSGRIFSAIDTLRDIYEGGWLKWKLAEIERKERRAGMRHAFITDTGKTGLLPERQVAEKAAATLLGKIKGGFLSLSSFHEVLSYAFGEKSDRVKSLVDAERAASGQYEDVNQDLADEVEALFTGMAGSVLKGERLRFDMAQPSIKTGKGEFSQLQAIQALLMWRQEDGRRHMEGAMDENGKPSGKWHYDQTWIDEITAALTPEARQLMGWIMQKYGAEWATLNPLYRSRYGVNMPAHDNYAPITVAPAQTKAGEVVDPVTGAAMSSGSILTPGSLRTRSRNAIAEPEFRDALQTLLNHTRQLEYWKAYYDLAVEANAILGNREVLNAVKAKGGDQAATALRKWVDAIAQGGFRDAAASLEMNKMFGRMTGRAATVGLLGRVSTLLVQSTQLAAASVKMPLGSYLRGMSKLLTGNLGYADAIKSDFIQRRFKTAPPIVRQAMENLGAQTKPNAMKHAARSLGQLLSGADALFTAGTYALLLDYHRGTGKALGLSGAELETHAHTEADRDTEQVAQPTRMATRSLAEITSTNPLAKITWAYASEARQKIALAAWAATKAKSDPVQFAKVMFLTFGVGGLMTQLLKNLWKEAKGDDDEKKWSPERLVMDAISSPLHGIPVVGALMNDGNMLSGASRIKSVDFKGDPIDIMRDLDTLLSVLGMFNDTASSTAALSHIGLDAAKVLENLAGK